MTVNDGLPLDESADYDLGHTDMDAPSPAGTGRADHITDPPTELLPVTAAPPPSMVPTDGFDQVTMSAPATALPLATPPASTSPIGSTADHPTQVLPMTPPAGMSARADSATEGSVEGDLFDGIADR
jgi:hypothetical protein